MVELSARRAQTRASLIAAAKRVFASRGIDVSVEEICEAAGFTRGAFYSNFSSKTELCVAVVEESMQDYLSVVRKVLPEALQSSAGASEVIDLAVANFMNLWGGDADTLLALHVIQLAATRTPELRGPVHRAQTAMASVLGEILSEAFEEFGVQPIVEMDVLLLVLRSVCLEVVLEDLLASGYDPEGLKQRMAIILKALLTGGTQS